MMEAGRDEKYPRNKGNAHVLQKREQDRLDRMVWSGGDATDNDTAGDVYYYYDPKHTNREPICAIKKGYGIDCFIYSVHWNGWGVAGCSDLDALKKDVEQKHRIDTMKTFSYKKNK